MCTCEALFLATAKKELLSESICVTHKPRGDLHRLRNELCTYAIDLIDFYGPDRISCILVGAGPKRLISLFRQHSTRPRLRAAEVDLLMVHTSRLSATAAPSDMN
jgi:hypothetical protein